MWPGIMWPFVPIPHSRMAVQISVKADVKRLSKTMSRIQKTQLNFIQKGALDANAFDAMRAVRQALPQALDNPLNYTIKGVQVQKATKQSLIATVGFAGKGFGKTTGSIPQANYMHFLIEGGTRQPKARAIAVPNPRSGKKVTNKAGNIPRGKIKKLLENTDRYFNGRPKQWGKAREGIWEKIPADSKMKKGKKQKIRMLIGWEPTTYYEKGHFKFERIVGHAVAKNFEKNFEKAFEKAMATMR